VESGEGIERSLTLRARIESLFVWNPVKELKGFAIKAENIAKWLGVESGEGIERLSTAWTQMPSLRQAVESGEGIERRP